MSEIKTDEQLLNTIAPVANAFGFLDVSADFSPFADLKVRWMRQATCIDLHVSDYLKEAPEEVITGIATCIFERIWGNESDYPDVATEYLFSQTFRDRNQDTWFQRHRAGAEISFELWDELKAEGVVKSDEPPAIRLGKRHICSTLMKAMIIPEEATIDTDLLKTALIVADFSIRQ